MRLFTLCCLLFSFQLAQAQTKQATPSYDSIDFKRVRVNNLFFGSKKAELEKKFGKPQKIITTEGLSKGLDLYADYYYGKSTLRVSPAGVFNGFRLKEEDFIFGYGTRLIRPGASLKEFAINFPTSFQAYAKDATGKFKLKIRPGNAYVVFKTKNGIVTEIETWEETLQ